MSVHNNVCGSATLYRGWKLYGASNNLVQELRLDDAWFHTTSCAPKQYDLSTGYLFPSCCFCCYGNNSPLACHWSAVKKVFDVVRFFCSEKLNFFNLKRRSKLQKKTPGLLHRIIM